MTHIQGPDFPTGGVIMGKSGIRNAYTTGRGKIILRAKAEIEEHNDRNRIVVTEIPYQVNKAKLEKHINELVRDGKIDGISSTRDESTEHIRLVIELKRDQTLMLYLTICSSITNAGYFRHHLACTCRQTAENSYTS